MRTNFQLKHDVVFFQQEYFDPFGLILYLVVRSLRLYKCKAMSEKAGINFALGFAKNHKNFAFKTNINRPNQLSHNPNST